MKYDIFWLESGGEPMKLLSIEAASAAKAKEIFWIYHALVKKEGD